MATSPSQQTPRWVEFGKGLREQWWAHLLIAGALTVVFGGASMPWQNALAYFGVSLLLSVGIGTVTMSIYVFVWGTVLIEGSLLRRTLVHGTAIAIGVVVGTELVVQTLHLLAYTGLEISVQRTGIWQVGGVITVVILIVNVVYDRLREHARTVEQREQQAQQALLRAQVDSLQ